MSVLMVGGAGLVLIGAAMLKAIRRRGDESASNRTDGPAAVAAARDRAESNIDDARIAVDRLRGRQWPL